MVRFFTLVVLVGVILSGVLMSQIAVRLDNPALLVVCIVAAVLALMRVDGKHKGKVKSKR